ncbi:MAG: hypothetical protein ACOYY2_11950 [Actinomycetota bacterium]
MRSDGADSAAERRERDLTRQLLAGDVDRATYRRRISELARDHARRGHPR